MTKLAYHLEWDEKSIVSLSESNPMLSRISPDERPREFVSVMPHLIALAFIQTNPTTLNPHIALKIFVIKYKILSN